MRKLRHHWNVFLPGSVCLATLYVGSCLGLCVPGLQMCKPGSGLLAADPHSNTAVRLHMTTELRVQCEILLNHVNVVLDLQGQRNKMPFRPC